MRVDEYKPSNNFSLCGLKLKLSRSQALKISRSQVLRDLSRDLTPHRQIQILQCFNVSTPRHLLWPINGRAIVFLYSTNAVASPRFLCQAHPLIHPPTPLVWSFALASYLCSCR